MEAIDAFGRLVFDTTLPIWRDRGWDMRYAGFYDRLTRELNPVPLPFKRLMVQCRQLYVFSHAEKLWPHQGWRSVADRCFSFIVAHYRDTQHGGWYFSIAPDGLPSDRRKDCYTHAFVLFGLAHYFHLTSSNVALQLAEETVDVIEQKLAAANGGFHTVAAENWVILPDIRRQNPHMHLLESFLALFDATGASRYRRHAERIIDLFSSRLFDRKLSTVGEFFDANWCPDSVKGNEIEPGHHFEWYWLLDRFEATVAPLPDAGLAEALFNWAFLHGIDAKHGGVFDQVDRGGVVLSTNKRLWPTTEAIKAHAILASKRGRHEDWQRLQTLIQHLLKHYQDPNGILIEHLDQKGRPTVTELFGSSPYHLLFAYSEAAKAIAGPSAVAIPPIAI